VAQEYFYRTRTGPPDLRSPLSSTFDAASEDLKEQKHQSSGDIRRYLPSKNIRVQEIFGDFYYHIANIAEIT
jgi:hypothetical protein